VAAVALTAGLAVATFVKAFGVGFLARPRSSAATAARESPPSMLVGMGIAALACIGLALAPTLVLPTLAQVAGGVTGSGPVVTGTVTIELVGVAGAMSPLLLVMALAVAIALVVALPRLLATLRDRRNAGGWKPAEPAGRVRTARLWDCGAGPLSARMQYTATSFAEPLQRVFENVLKPVQEVDITHHKESRYLVAAVAYRRSVPDRIERRFYEPMLAATAAWGRAGRRLATGSVHRYLGYGFVTLCGLLVLLVVTR
jgi:hydrogenase-4 component B